MILPPTFSLDSMVMNSQKVNIDALVKSSLNRHTGESRYPEILKILDSVSSTE